VSEGAAGRAGGHVPQLRVALATPLRDATAAGQAVAAGGGNAIDAALAAAAVLTVAYPHNCALGGDLLALFREPDGASTFINASGRAPSSSDAETIRRNHKQMPLTGPDTITVPGLVSGWGALHDRGGSLEWSQLLSPAVAAAADGVAVSAGLASSLGEDWPELSKSTGLREVFAPDGNPLVAGQTLRQPALAQTLHTLAADGPRAMYGGEIGARLVAGLQRFGVSMTLDDLVSHEVTEQSPLTLAIDGWNVRTAPPNSQGFVLLRLLGMLADEGFPSDSPLLRRVPTAVLARAFQLTADERDRLLADPAAMTVDVNDLLSDASLRELLARAREPATPGARAVAKRPDGDTVAVVAADSAGRSVSLIQSLYYGFGSQVLEPTTGIVMHNRGACFSLDPRSPNVFAPGKRPAHTLTPVLAERPDERLVVGTMGGEVQPQILLQVLAQLFGNATPQDAVAAPRWTVGPWDRGDRVDTLNWERDIGSEQRVSFDAWSGPLNELPALSGEVGHSQAIRARGGMLLAGTDPRADGGGSG